MINKGRRATAAEMRLESCLAETLRSGPRCPEATRAAQVLRAQEGYGQVLRTETIGGYVASVVGTHPSSRLLEALHARQAA